MIRDELGCVYDTTYYPEDYHNDDDDWSNLFEPDYRDGAVQLIERLRNGDRDDD
jgi:hypothetical protein